MAVRMVSIDTPETHLGGNPAAAQATLERAKARLQPQTDH
jgi:endonuclease YncB( thermonuclease family)